jgi:hypothetical protein
MNAIRTTKPQVRKNVIKKAPKAKQGMMQNAWDGLKILFLGWLGLAAFGDLITQYIEYRF